MGPGVAGGIGAGVARISRVGVGVALVVGDAVGTVVIVGVAAFVGVAVKLGTAVAVFGLAEYSVLIETMARSELAGHSRTLMVTPFLV